MENLANSQSVSSQNNTAPMIHEAIIGIAQSQSLCVTKIGNSQPATHTDVGAENSQSMTHADVGAENSQPTTHTDVGAENLQPATHADVGVGNSQLTTHCDVGIGSSQPTTHTDVSAGNSQPTTHADVGTGNSQPTTHADVGVGNSQLTTHCDVGIGNSQSTMMYIDVGTGTSKSGMTFADVSIGTPRVAEKSNVNVAKSVEGHEGAVNQIDHEAESQSTDFEISQHSCTSQHSLTGGNLSDGHDDSADNIDENEGCQSHDQELSEPDIYSHDDDLSDPPSPTHDTTTEMISRSSSASDSVFTRYSANGSKRRRALGPLQQQVPTSVNSSRCRDSAAFTKSNNRENGELRFVPSGIGEFVINSEDSVRISPSSSKGSKIRGKRDSSCGDNFLLQRTHAIIRVNPQQRLRLGLSRRVPIPPLHPGLRRNDENEN
ncbi:uncharacterized protein LOC110841682 [Folsomia candida]|uniref:41 kDa spicule matrix protein n=1 Tax=Folsomia candida TaxID=158441 RepID=A0A226EXF0_FOLCA|nr:uncharacterized protein LOC110841682 [Folsomia candida]OXA61837.1 41 kDa spicule matrix protein [Folsomia candida]